MILVMNERPAQPTETAASAIASLALGICSCLLLLGPLAGIPAVVCGHVALSNMKANPRLGGKGLAIAGLVTGYLGIAWPFLLVGGLLLLTTTGAAPFVYKFF
jgi:uncharacterized RDD family membrane protein YckC